MAKDSQFQLTDNVDTPLDNLDAVEAALEQGQTPYDTHVLLERREKLLEAEASAPKKKSRRNK